MRDIKYSLAFEVTYIDEAGDTVYSEIREREVEITGFVRSHQNTEWTFTQIRNNISNESGSPKTLERIASTLTATRAKKVPVRAIVSLVSHCVIPKS